MATHVQGTTKKHPANQGTTLLGPQGSDAARLEAAFPAGSDSGSTHKIPTPAEVTEMGKNLIQSAIVNDGGHTFGEFNRDYGHPNNPEFSDVKTGAGGLPANAQAPNVASPGVGSTNPADLPEGPAPFQGGGEAFSRGDGSLSPKTTSKETAAQTLGELMFGKSSKNSDVGV